MALKSVVGIQCLFLFLGLVYFLRSKSVLSKRVVEVASARALQALLAPGKSSIGVSIDVIHIAPTPLGAEVTAMALYTGHEGKLYLFEVWAYDAGGEIGRGFHKRAIVSSECLARGPMKRNSPES